MGPPRSSRSRTYPGFRDAKAPALDQGTCRPAPARCHNYSLEEPLTYNDGVACPYHIIQLDADVLFFAVHDSHDLNAARRAAIREAARERQRLQHGRVLLLQAVGARILHLAEHVDAFGARDKNRVAVAQQRILGKAAVFELAQVNAPSASMVNLPERSAWSYEVIVRTSCGPTT